MAPQPNQTLGRFTLRDRLASTGLATVYAAEDGHSKRPVVVKVFRAYFSGEPELLDEYFELLQRIADLHHPHILAALDSGREGDPWVAMELMSGGSLKDRIGQPITLAEVDRIASQVASALDAAHAAGLRHWDIKPSNVLIDGDGAYRLADFGMAILGSGADPLMRSLSTTPLPAYMASEQALAMSLTERSDVYSLGVLLYHLLTGRVPYTGVDPAVISAKQLAGPPDRPDEIEAAVPSSVGDVVLTALASNPEKRPASAGELARSFHQAIEATGSAATELLSRPEPSQQATPPSDAPVAVADVAIARGDRVHCHICGAFNPPDSPHCEACWANLNQAGIVDERSMLERQELKKKGDLLTRTVATALVAVGILVGVILFIVAGGGVPAPLSSITSASAANEWAMHQRDPRHTAFSPGSAPDLQGEVQWSRIVAARVVADPVVADGIVYMTSGEKSLLALDLETGAVIWESKLGGIINESPALAGDMVYVGLINGLLMGIDRATGERQWTFRTGGPIFGAPTVKDGLVYVGNGNGIFNAVDAITGKKIWDLNVDLWISSSPAISDDGIVVFGARDGNIYFLDAKSGKSRLRFRVVSGVESSPVVVGNRVYINADDGRLYALDLDERRRLLDRQFLRVRNQLFVWDILKKPPSQRGFIWSSVLSRRGNVFATPAVAPGIIYVVASDGRLVALDLETQEKLWTFAGTRQLSTSPTIIGDTVFVGSRDGTVYSLDALTGEERWSWQAFPNSSITTSAVVAGDALLITAMQERAVLEEPVHVTDDAPRANAEGESLENGWYYRLVASPCDTDPPLMGPHPKRDRALTAGRLAIAPCSVFYVLK